MNVFLSDPHAMSDRVEQVLSLAGELLSTIEPADRRLVSVVRDRSAAEFTFTLTDEVLRCPEHRASAEAFRSLVARGLPRSFPLADRVLLAIGAHATRIAPGIVMKLVTARLRQVSATSVLPAEDPGLSKRLARTRGDGSRTNVNVLGEAIIGEKEALRRRDRVVEMLARRDVDAVSVKLSSIAANLSPLAFDATVDRVVERLIPIYRAALAREVPALVTLDMEEYRDLELTTEVLIQALSLPEFDQLRAGIVLQAYLPDAHAIAERLLEFARDRHACGGAPVRIRLVKGANLAMERVEAELRGWPLATFGSKVEVDASYKRLLRRLLDPRNRDAIVVGLASHNVFDIAYGLTLANEHRATGNAVPIEFETLEGMATGLSVALAHRGEVSLVYSPVVARNAFEAAIAYLVRRLDENTTPENFLHAVLELETGSPRFRIEADKFVASLEASYSLDTRSRREHEHPRSVAGFFNEVDTDFALERNRRMVMDALRDWSAPSEPVRPVVAGTPRTTHTQRVLTNPSTGEALATVELADVALVDECLGVARAAIVSWNGRRPTNRAEVICRIAEVVAARRFEILATMAFETGKTISQGDPEVSEAIDFARYYASNVDLIQELIDSGLTPAPHGVVVVTPPWNFPFAILMGGVTGALMAGNTVIIKPAPQAVLCAELVARCCWEAGVGHEALQFLPCGDDEVGQHLVSHAGVDTVLLTGGIETATMFQRWRPERKVLAETSGKNAMVITASADIDSALKDLVASAFGHAGQKCSAASLAILAPCWYDNPDVLERIADAVRSLNVGSATELSTDMGPLIESPSPKLQHGLMTLEPGESWLVEPRQLDQDGRMWTPGVRLGVAPGSWFHQTECFGPILGIMRAETLDEALTFQNGVDFGLTAGLQSLDEREVARWVDRVECGNLYVNRSITGAIVRRQPFGGWKSSSVGPGSKAGGPGYVISLMNWEQGSDPTGIDSSIDNSELAARFRAVGDTYYFGDQDPSGLVSESNVLRHRVLPKGVAVRLGQHAPSWTASVLAAAAAAARTTTWSSDVSVESDIDFVVRLLQTPVDRVRLVGGASVELYSALHELGVTVVDAPLVTNPRLELAHWLREQSVTVTRHRHGHRIST